MSFKNRLVLRAFCVWTFFVWIVLIKNMITDDDHGWTFRAIHITLALISIAFAAVIWPMTRRHPHKQTQDD